MRTRTSADRASEAAPGNPSPNANPGASPSASASARGSASGSPRKAEPSLDARDSANRADTFAFDYRM
jgi:hypothetical protein